jgi:2-oxoisovalerate dehydrogenase E1 component
MEATSTARALRVVETFSRRRVKDLAIDFLLYGTLAEIFGRAGFNKGMGGSMHAFFPPFGVMPNNAIVGGSATSPSAAALFKRVNRKPGIVIANIGDASMGCGPVWEGMMFAAMDQYRTLWARNRGGAAPMLFNFMNNFYGMGGQPSARPWASRCWRGSALGVNPEQMHAERVDGYNPLAVVDAIERKREILEAGRGPVLLDTITYRFSGHSPSDASSLRGDAAPLLRRPDHGGLRRGEPRLGRRLRLLPRPDRGLPYHRLFNSPISEGAIVGTAVGYALAAAGPWSS